MNRAIPHIACSSDGQVDLEKDKQAIRDHFAQAKPGPAVIACDVSQVRVGGMAEQTELAKFAIEQYFANKRK